MKTVRLSLLVVVGGVAAMAGIAFLLWYYLPRKKLAVEHTVTVPEDEITIEYEVTPAP